MKHDKHQNDADDPARIEALLYASADYEPEQDANYNFAAKALSSKMRCRRSNSGAWALAGSCLAAAVLIGVWLAKSASGSPSIMQMANFPSKPSFPSLTNEPFATPAAKQSPDRSHDNTSAPVRTRTEQDNSEDNVQLVSDEAPRPRHKRHVPKVKWENETVERYASGVLTPAWVPEQDTEHGGTVLRPALVNLPIDSGENPMPNGSTGQGSVSLVSYEENH
jgi:hypothetical protein